MYSEKSFTTHIGNEEITIATGMLAGQAGGAVTIRVGDSMLLSTATMSKSVREGLDFFPLSVDFEEKMYAGGRIPGGYFKREGRPTMAAILIARLTDRPLRPLFPKGMRNEVQIITSSLSADGVAHLDIMAVNAASAALHISNVPWAGPIAAVRVGLINGELVANPTVAEMENSTLDLRMAGSKEAIIMVEAGADEVTEAELVDALDFGHKAMQPFIDTVNEMREAVGKEKDEVVLMAVDEELETAVKAKIGSRIQEIVASTTDRSERNEKMSTLREEIVDGFAEMDETTNLKEVRSVITSVQKKAIRDRILYDGIRPDGRDYSTVRALSSDIGIIPRTHGSGLFKRGETQVLSLATLGTPREAQRVETINGDITRRYMHHYNFPPFSTGETWFLRGPKRREIGHGALAETALRPMIPAEDEFPYTIRVVSEVLSSNGSTSQASVCGSTLALMDCGVPIKRPVAGVAMGLVTDGEKFAVLTDIQGLEDHLGDMDFKVAGTSKGITALQMDIKISGLTKDLMAQALDQAHAGRMHILANMLETISTPREALSDHAPRMLTVKIDPEKIGAVIGKGGATIRSLEETFEVKIDIQDDGTIFVAGVDGPKAETAASQIKAMTESPEPGTIYPGKVVRITDFGAFIEFLPGTDGLVHISQISAEHVKRVEDAFQLGDEVMVMVTDVSPDGKVRLSRKAVLEGYTLEQAREDDKPKPRSGGRGRDNRGGNRGGGNRGRDNRGGGRGGSRR
ncbi:MAG: polyribonucleotide nucleotidyltransferase [Chloroflexi bacterium]|nr:polyribonucleotide nucleotidyltransferase [Chloroflexota bacterium]